MQEKWWKARKNGVLVVIVSHYITPSVIVHRSEVEESVGRVQERMPVGLAASVWLKEKMEATSSRGGGVQE